MSDALEKLKTILVRVDARSSSPVWLKEDLIDLKTAIEQQSPDDVINVSFDQGDLEPTMTDAEIMGRISFFARVVRLTRQAVSEGAA